MTIAVVSAIRRVLPLAAVAMAALAASGCADFVRPKPANLEAGYAARRAAAVGAVGATPIEIAPRRAPPPPLAVESETLPGRPPTPPTAGVGAPAVPAGAAIPAVATAAALPASGWSVETGSTLRTAIEGWAARARCAAAPERTWSVVWRAKAVYRIEAGHRFDAVMDFPAAADALLDAFARHARPPIEWSIWTGNCAVVVNERPEGEGNAR